MTTNVAHQRMFAPIIQDGATITVQRFFVPIVVAVGTTVAHQRLFVPIIVPEGAVVTRRRNFMSFSP